MSYELHRRITQLEEALKKLELAYRTPAKLKQRVERAIHIGERVETVHGRGEVIGHDTFTDPFYGGPTSPTSHWVKAEHKPARTGRLVVKLDKSPFNRKELAFWPEELTILE